MTIANLLLANNRHITILIIQLLGSTRQIAAGYIPMSFSKIR